MSADCATFSKIDGHRLTVKEIFKCGEAQIKQLMWQYRGDLPLMEVSKPEELVVGDAGYIDGWVVVIGPAYHHTGAEYRIRYGGGAALSAHRQARRILFNGIMPNEQRPHSFRMRPSFGVLAIWNIIPAC